MTRAALAFTVPWLLWEHFRMLTLAERGSWIAWVGIFVMLRNALRPLAPKNGARRAATDKP